MIAMQALYDKMYGGSVHERLLVAREIFSSFGDRLLKREDVSLSLNSLCRSIDTLSVQMSAMKMGEICTSCAEGKGGGCCSLYMAGETDVVQLLMNMLAGVDIEIQRDDGEECCYLGRKGCVFLFKPIFCLNYNCKKITEMDRRNLLLLEEVTGNLLREQHDLERLLLQFLRDVPVSVTPFENDAEGGEENI